MGCEFRGSGDFSGLFFLCEQTDGNRDDSDFSGSLCWFTFAIKARAIYGSPPQLKNSEWV